MAQVEMVKWDGAPKGVDTTATFITKYFDFGTSTNKTNVIEVTLTAISSPTEVGTSDYDYYITAYYRTTLKKYPLS